MRLLARVDQVVLLKVGELSEALLAQAALEGSLAAVHSKMDLQLANKYKKKSTLQLRWPMNGDFLNSADESLYLEVGQLTEGL